MQGTNLSLSRTEVYHLWSLLAPRFPEESRAGHVSRETRDRLFRKISNYLVVAYYGDRPTQQQLTLFDPPTEDLGQRDAHPDALSGRGW